MCKKCDDQGTGARHGPSDAAGNKLLLARATHRHFYSTTIVLQKPATDKGVKGACGSHNFYNYRLCISLSLSGNFALSLQTHLYKQMLYFLWTVPLVPWRKINAA